MPVYRGPDGKIIEKKTEKDASTKTTKHNSDPLPETPKQTGQQDDADRLDAPTRLMTGTPSSSGSDDDEKTRVLGGRHRRRSKEQSPDQAGTVDAMDDPVVGWLVIVSGPGKGRALPLGYGTNSIGRGETDRVKVDFGDNRISRSGQSTVTYDPRGRVYYVQHGGGTNLTYVDDKPVLTPTELAALTHITIGDTVLRFVPLCGEEFDWQDLD